MTITRERITNYTIVAIVCKIAAGSSKGSNLSLLMGRIPFGFCLALTKTMRFQKNN